MKLKLEGEIKKVVDERFGNILAEIGDWKGWESHLREDQEKLLERLVDKVCVHFGRLVFARLLECQQQITGLWHWSGCCMHKDLNTFKGGAVRLRTFWKEAGLEGPVGLLSWRQEEQEALAGM